MEVNKPKNCGGRSISETHLSISRIDASVLSQSYQIADHYKARHRFAITLGMSLLCDRCVQQWVRMVFLLLFVWIAVVQSDEATRRRARKGAPTAISAPSVPSAKIAATTAPAATHAGLRYRLRFSTPRELILRQRTNRSAIIFSCVDATACRDAVRTSQCAADGGCAPLRLSRTVL